MEFTIARQARDVKQTKEKLQSHDVAAKRAVSTLQTELRHKVEQVSMKVVTLWR